MSKNVLIILNVLVVLVLVTYVALTHKKEQKRGYLISTQVFENFDGKKFLEAKLNTVKTENKKKLDSLFNLIEADQSNKVLVSYYQETAQTYSISEKQMSDKFTADIWKSINGYISDFGKQNNYDFIFGATGDGNLMYADSLYNVTDEVILFMNEKYSGQ